MRDLIQMVLKQLFFPKNRKLTQRLGPTHPDLKAYGGSTDPRV